MEPSRFMDEVPAELVERVEPRFPSHYQSNYQSSFRGDFARRGAAGRARDSSREAAQTYSYEDEDQSSSLTGLRLGAKVRHQQFGVGTILSIEELVDDLKLVVRFSVGAKTLRAKYAKLEMI